MPPLPWPAVSPRLDSFRHPPRAYGILPFWFLNGALDPDEMRRQLREFRDKGMPGVILHGRYGLEMPYIGPAYLDRIRLAVEEADRLGLETWIYDEMNWPSGTADGRVLQERPDLAQRYLECIAIPVRGPWFTFLTGADSRYLDFERSTPVAAFALGDGQVIDLTPNLSFRDVIPWEAPPGHWRLLYIVEKRADYYIDALNPEATAAFLRLGYNPYIPAAGSRMGGSMRGFYTDEPAMHYYLTGGDNPIVPWSADLLHRFQERTGYALRPRLPDLFFDVRPDSARVRHDFYTTLTDLYSAAYYGQIHEWCREHGVLFTGHLLYEEWLRKMIRVEGNPFKHYVHFDVVGVDHLYPFIGDRDRPDEHVAIKLASSATHQLGSQRLLCESFGGIFMDATLQRMKWIADWQYVLGVTLLNPHGFHYTLEGPRKRDWPPSMFYQYPWWHYFGAFSEYISRLSSLLTGGSHVAKVGVVWPINALFGTYIPHTHTAIGDRTEHDFNALTDLLLRLHYDFDYIDEDMLAGAEVENGTVRLGDETYELLVLPPMAYVKLGTVEQLETFVRTGGRVLGMVFLPDRAFAPDGLVDIAGRIGALFGVDPRTTQREYRTYTSIQTRTQEHPGGGRCAFMQTYALTRQLPLHLQEQMGTSFVVEPDGAANRYYAVHPSGERQEITAQVVAERAEVAEAVEHTLRDLVAPDVVIDNPEIFCLHRVKEGRDLYFLVNPTFLEQPAQVALCGIAQPLCWDPSTGTETPIAPWREDGSRTCFRLTLPPAGSTFIVTSPQPALRIVETTLTVDAVDAETVRGYTDAREAIAVIARDGRRTRLAASVGPLPDPVTLDGSWKFAATDANALVIGHFWAIAEAPGTPAEVYAAPGANTAGWVSLVPGAWSYQRPANIEDAYPIAVWYRASFYVDDRPSHLNLIADGFAGSGWALFVNGRPATNPPVRSHIDCQMDAVDITDLVQPGDNVIALRLIVTSPTDGLLDLLKITGDFSLTRHPTGGYGIAAPVRELAPAPWTTQGYPFYSGRGLYRRRFTLPDGYAGHRIFLEPAMGDDVLEVVVNGRPAGVRLWAPYTIEITEFVHPGENTIEMRVANTLVNLLEATERPSGLAGAPRLAAYAGVTLPVPAGSPEPDDDQTGGGL